MRHIVMTFATVSMVLAVSTAAIAGFQYLSPRPGSSRLSRRTNIILRPGALLDRATVDGETQLIAIGSKSGRHTGTLLLSDDSRTLVFNPDMEFESGETVTVKLNKGIRTTSGSEVEPVEFSFTVTKTDPEVANRFPRQPEFDSDNTTASFGTYQAGQTSSRLDTLPTDFPDITLLDSDSPSPGCIFLSSFRVDTLPNTPYLMILDDSARPVAYRMIDGNGLDFKLQPNGFLTYHNFNDTAFIELDSSLTPIDTFRCGNGYQTDLHELRILPNGHALLLGDDYEVVPMDTIVPGGDSNAVVLGAIIQELDQSKNVVFQWRSWDHFRITDATHVSLTAHTIDYVHANAVDVDADGNILLSSRHLDEITKINRETGDIIWRLGGRNNQFTFVNDPSRFSYQHAVRRIGNGDITLFDNGDYHSPRVSRAAEYAVDDQAMTATLVWQYYHSPEVYAQAMGYVQRLQNGNTVIGWGTANPTVTEVRPDGSTALEISLPSHVYSYRAFRFPWPAGIQTGVGGQPSPVSFSLAQNYPNPFNPTTNIQFSLGSAGHATLAIFDVLGRHVATLFDGNLAAGTHVEHWDARAFASGVYIYRLIAGGLVQSKRLLLLK